MLNSCFVHRRSNLHQKRILNKVVHLLECETDNGWNVYGVESWSEMCLVSKNVSDSVSCARGILAPQSLTINAPASGGSIDTPCGATEFWIARRFKIFVSKFWRATQTPELSMDSHKFSRQCIKGCSVNVAASDQRDQEVSVFLSISRRYKQGTNGSNPLR